MHPPVPRTPAHADLPPPPAFPSMTDEQRSRAVAHMDELLAHVDDAAPREEPDWDVESLFPPGRVR